MIKKLREKIKQKSPLIHCITNPISMNACANTILALGARPIMAEHPLEVEEITRTAGALLLNLGNISDIRMEAMKRAVQEAQNYKVPIILDAVGVACSKLRRTFAKDLLQTYALTVVKGNASEILALNQQEYHAVGIDAEKTIKMERVAMAAVSLAKAYHTIVLVSGKIDLITDGERLVQMENGSLQLTTVTGTGCMLGAVCACCLAVAREIEAPVTACAVMGICGELAETEKGSGTFMVNLLDALSTWKEETVRQFLKKEVRNVEGYGFETLCGHRQYGA